MLVRYIVYLSHIDGADWSRVLTEIATDFDRLGRYRCTVCSRLPSEQTDQIIDKTYIHVSDLIVYICKHVCGWGF